MEHGRTPSCRSGWPGGTIGRCAAHDCLIMLGYFDAVLLGSNADFSCHFCCIIIPTGFIIHKHILNISCRENGLEYKIKLIKGRMEDVELPVSKVGYLN